MLIVEDQLLIAQDIAFKLERNGIEVLHICPSGEEALDFLSSNHTDLILMDIELSGAMDGISTAAVVKARYNIPVIYLTDHTDAKMVDRAKKTMPANYLPKPFNEQDLVRALEIAFFNASQQEQKNEPTQDHIFLRTSSQEFVKIYYHDILFLEADRAYSKVVTQEKTFTLSSNMKRIHEQFNHPAFFRVHRHHVVNINRVTAINGNILQLEEHAIQMSKDYRDTITAKLKFVK